MLSTIGLLLGVKARSLRGAARSMWEGNRLKVVAGAVTLAVIIPAMYLLFRYLFGRLAAIDDEAFGIALSTRLLTSAFMAFTVFIAVSSMISGVATLFRSRETLLLLSLPFGSSGVAVFRTLESWFYAGWSTVLLGGPVIAAFASVTGQPLWTAVAGLAMLLPFILVSVSAGTIVMSLLSRLGGMGALKRGLGGVVVLSAAGLLLFFQGMNPDAVVIQDQGSRSLAAVERFVAGLPSTGHSLWPHALLGSVLANTATGESPGFVVRAALLLTAEAVLVSGLALLLTAPGFRRRFSRVSGESGRSVALPLLRRGGALRALFEKDILLFVRDPVQLSQLALLAGLFVMYAANLDRFPFDFSSRLWLGVAVFMNISFSGFVMATLLVRFCFPSISLEGPGLSFVMQIPGARRLLPWSKWLQSFSGVLPLMLLTGIYTTLRLGAGTILLLETAGAVLLLSFALVSINTSLGTIFPRFEDLSAASIASGQGGIIAAFSSMGFVLLMVSALSFTTRAYLVEGFRESAMRGPILLLMAVMIPVTALVTLATMASAVRSFSRRDF